MLSLAVDLLFFVSFGQHLMLRKKTDSWNPIHIINIIVERWEVKQPCFIKYSMPTRIPWRPSVWSPLQAFIPVIHVHHPLTKPENISIPNPFQYSYTQWDTWTKTQTTQILLKALNKAPNDKMTTPLCFRHDMWRKLRAEITAHHTLSSSWSCLTDTWLWLLIPIPPWPYGLSLPNDPSLYMASIMQDTVINLC